MPPKVDLTTFAQSWSNLVMPTPTFNQQTNTLPTVSQLVDSEWDNGRRLIRLFYAYVAIKGDNLCVENHIILRIVKCHSVRRTVKRMQNKFKMCHATSNACHSNHCDGCYKNEKFCPS